MTMETWSILATSNGGMAQSPFNTRRSLLSPAPRIAPKRRAPRQHGIVRRDDLMDELFAIGIFERSRQINADLKDISPIDLTGGINAANDGGQALAVNVLFGDPAIIARLSGAVHLEKMRVPERQD